MAVGDGVAHGDGVGRLGQHERDMLAGSVQAHRPTSGGLGGQGGEAPVRTDQDAVGRGVLGFVLDERNLGAVAGDLGQRQAGHGRGCWRALGQGGGGEEEEEEGEAPPDGCFARRGHGRSAPCLTAE